jgi:HlyD family secretion protein
MHAARGQQRQFMRRLKTLFTLAVPLAAIAAGVAWMLGIGSAGTSGLVYDSAEVTRGVIRKVVTTSGPVRALVTVSVGSQLSGQVREVLTDFNAEVKQGDLLAAIDDKTYAARVASAKADLAAARAQLTNQQAALQRAQAQLRQAERATERQQTLAAKGIAAQAALDTALRDADVARADIAVAQAQIESARASVQQRLAQLDQAQIDLDRTRILSPIDGTVISRTIDPGQTVAASLQAPELFKIAQDLRRIRIEAQVNEADVGSVAEGNPVLFTVDAYPERQFDGTVTQVRLAATELANVVTYTVIIEATNEDRRLFPGMTANVQIESAKREGVLRIPNDATRYRPRGVAAAAQGGQGSAERSERQVERVKTEVGLNEEQEKAAREAVQKLYAELRQSGQSAQASAPFDPAAMRQRVQAAMDAALLPTLSEEQRQLYDRYKRGREGTKFAQVWALTPEGTPDRRRVRLGIADEQFTEVLGGELKEGDKVIVRAREAKK